MTCLANLNSNLVYASPDSPSTGYPDFRVLTANDLPGTAASAMTANSANIQYTDTYFSTPFKLPANTIQAGTTWRVTVVSDNLYLYGDVLNIRMGPNGTTSDNVMFSTGLPNPCAIQFLLTARGNSNTTTVMSACLNPIGSGGTQYLPTQSANTIDATIDNFIGVSYHFAYPGAGTNIFQNAVIEQVR